MRNQLEVLKNDHGKSKRKSGKDQGNNEKNQYDQNWAPQKL